MLKFFRKIRQQLLNQGQVKRYLLYAVGEILLVVIGILIALQINNWNQERFERTNESLLQSIEFENLLDMQLAYKDGLMIAFYSTLEVCKQIKEKISQEIK